MRLTTKWIVTSLCGGALLSVALLLFRDSMTDIVMQVRSRSALATVFWPVSVALSLAGPGPAIGPPEQHMHEWTSVHDTAVAAGIGLSWALYTSLVFLILRFRKSG
jgi:hypothetical protein